MLLPQDSRNLIFFCQKTILRAAITEKQKLTHAQKTTLAIANNTKKQ
jgi:hypothetical protein